MNINIELFEIVLTVMLVLVGVSQAVNLFHQKHQNQLSLLQSYRQKWQKIKFD